MVRPKYVCLASEQTRRAQYAYFLIKTCGLGRLQGVDCEYRVNLLEPELFFLILTHPVHKM